MCSCSQGGFTAKTAFAEVAVIVAREMMKAHIISNSKDSFAVVLYNTVRKTHSRHLQAYKVPIFTS